MNPATFYIVRHGETDWNAEKRIQGHTDTQLTEKGRDQAWELAAELAGISFDIAVSSDLARARDTAEIILDGRDMALLEDARLRERDYGSMVGKLRDEYAAFFDQDPTGQGKAMPEPDAETEDEAAVRFKACLDELSAKYPGRVILIVTHKGCIHAFLRAYFSGKYAHLKLGDIGNTGYVKVADAKGAMAVVEAQGITL